ncbi:hypothetical protein BCR35DRAFT_308180 [Leucosporidium creatinivorum]|uniref:Uncharacterized protein n=1 Tax=Leucosporidium creatinivorum TaxID=106004 RepID=A0A1Y2EED1_9BASI|nr:hypothetical protein BCR35DRAFT_308180 [Leucosporidium creatinivorum]
MSIREPSIGGNAKPTTLEIAQFTEEVIKRNMQNALSPQDKTIMEAANKKLMVHATTGLWLGSTCGAILAFRSRWRAGRAAQQAMKGGVTPQVPKLYYGGAAGAGPAGQQTGTQTKSRLAFIAKGLGLGMLGALAGTQIGVWTGTSAAQKHIKASGREEAIAQGLKLAMDRALAEIRANSNGIEIKNPLLNKVASSGFSHGDSDSSEFVDSPPSDHDAQLPTPQSEPESHSTSSDEPHSRWDELRQARPSGPSSWDGIRERTGRAGVPPPSINRGDQAARPNESEQQGRGAGESEDKAFERRQFEEMMERERKGGEESFNESKWK